MDQGIGQILEDGQRMTGIWSGRQKLEQVSDSIGIRRQGTAGYKSWADDDGDPSAQVVSVARFEICRVTT